jgi:hypothetical protein
MDEPLPKKRPKRTLGNPKVLQPGGLNPRGPGTTHKPKILQSHRMVFENYKNQGFRNLKKAIRTTGVFSESLADHPSVLTSTKSWKLIMQEYMPEEHLALRHSELLDKRDYRTVKNTDGTTYEVDNGPETNAVSKGLELAYRLRGSFQKDEAPPASTVMYNLFYKPEVREEMRLFEDKIKLSLYNEINKRNLADIEDEKERSGKDTGLPVDADGGGDKKDTGHNDDDHSVSG